MPRNGKVKIIKRATKTKKQIKKAKYEYARELEYQENLAVWLKKFC
jgi:hypothetical protein